MERKGKKREEKTCGHVNSLLFEHLKPAPMHSYANKLKWVLSMLMNHEKSHLFSHPHTREWEKVNVPAARWGWRAEDGWQDTKKTWNLKFFSMTRWSPVRWECEQGFLESHIPRHHEQESLFVLFFCFSWSKSFVQSLNTRKTFE